MNNNDDLPLKDRMKAVFLSEDMADIHFSVGPDEAIKERIPGHKLLLVSASEAFRGMLYGHFEVPETIDVDDTTPEAFKVMLRYIYTDEVYLSSDNAFPVLYLAKKYLLNNLVAQVSQYIATAFRVESIAKVLPHLHLVDGEHAERVWDAIDLYAVVVLESPEFLELGHAALCEILRRDGLHADEIIVYNSALAWARAERARKHLPFNAREVLGNALKLIRFPLMSIEEFASGPAKSSLLTDREKIEIYNWYGQRASQELTNFSSTPRKCPMLCCNRFDTSNIINLKGGDWDNTRDFNNFFIFSVNARVRIHGVTFFGRKNESNVYEVDLALLNAISSEVLATTHAKVTTVASEDTYKVLFDRPVMIAPGVQYVVTAVSVGPDSMCAENGRSEVICEHGRSTVKFAFTYTGLRGHDQYDVSVMGHIPVIFFSFP